MTYSRAAPSYAAYDDVQDALRDVPTLDPVPRQWRHITMTGMGHVQDVPDDLRDAAVDSVRRALTGFGPINATFEKVSIFPEAVAVRPSAPDPFTRLQNLAQRATSQVVTVADPESPRFRAHVSSHYARSVAPVAPLRRAMINARVVPSAARFTHLSLIEMHRDRQMYEWRTICNVAFDE